MVVDVGSRRPGELVEGVVVSHEAYGVFVDVDECESGLVVITLIDDEPRPPLLQFPAVGSTVRAVFLGYAVPGNQPRLSLRPRCRVGREGSIAGLSRRLMAAAGT